VNYWILLALSKEADRLSDASLPEPAVPSTVDGRSMNRTIQILAVLCLLLGGVGPVRAEFIIGLYNTGVNTSGSLATDQSADAHYTLISTPTSNLPATAFVADSSAYPFVPGGWLPDGPLSKWIDPLPNQSIGNPPGNYTYRTTFQLSGGDPTSVVVSGQWTLDNIGVDILINGHSTGTYYDAPGDYTFKAFQSFVLPSNYFIDGTNITPANIVRTTNSGYSP
jgi:hypothetical protein